MAASNYSPWGWERFFEEMETFLIAANREIGSVSREYAEFVVERLGVCFQALSSICRQIESGEEDAEMLEMRDALVEIRGCCNSLLVLWQSYMDELDSNYAVVSRARMESYQAPRISEGRGRPRTIISREQLQYLRSLNFSWTQISELLGVSRMTIYRRRRDFGMDDFDEATRDISDNELQRLLQIMRREMPNLGEVLVTGQLHAMGYAVSRQRVRNAIHATDPLNTALRWRGITARRPYSVAGPNSLWHIDGHHKLIRWGLVIHGGIDGYSRLVVYLHCSNNNRATTVYEHFMSAVRQYALPSRVRSDHGRENYLVAVHMLEHRGHDRNSMITGSSVHNQRIERLGCDMHRCVTSVYYRLFYFLEYRNHLIPDNKFHRYALHYIYLPRINRSLKVFKEGWNNHSIRTEHSLSPNQLFVQGALQLQRTGLHALDFFEHVDNMYGVEDDDTAVENEYTVHIPSNSFSLTEEHLVDLQSSVTPLAESDNFAIDLYLQTLTFLRTIVSNNPHLYTVQ